MLRLSERDAQRIFRIPHVLPKRLERNTELDANAKANADLTTCSDREGTLQANNVNKLARLRKAALPKERERRK